ncbi:hypothetical protein NL676_023347 [Syzygium grande]|nr:hypothetical protein NL676_023347 [Syzygium grande]
MTSSNTSGNHRLEVPSVTRDVSGEQLSRGTKITLFLKEDQVGYFPISNWIMQHLCWSTWRRKIKDLVNKHPELISYPIYLRTMKTTEKEISDDENEDESKKEEDRDFEDVDEEKKD